VLSRSLTEESAAKSAILESAGNFSPRIEEWSSGNAFQCVIDIAGTDKLFGPPISLAHSLREQLDALGITASIAASNNFHASVCFARGQSSQPDVAIIATGEVCARLAALSLNVLNISDEHAQTLSLWGIHTLGMLAALPEKELIARIGQEGKRLRLLARGELPHLFMPHEPVLTLEESIDLDMPVELLDSLLFVIGVMLEQLTLRASARVLALASATITLSLEGGQFYTRTVRPTLPTNDRHIWIKLIHLDLEAHPPRAAILSLTMKAEPGNTSKVQLGLFSSQLPEASRLDVTLARISAIVGEDWVGCAVLEDTHQPDGFRMEPFSLSSKPVATLVSSQPRSAMRRLRPAESTTVTLRENRPATFVFQQKRFIIEQAYGPWMMSGDWWNSNLWNLQQWDLLARSHDGSSLCCCLAHELVHNCWLMVALYD
jgi:protein ImuB